MHRAHARGSIWIRRDGDFRTSDGFHLDAVDAHVLPRAHALAIRRDLMRYLTLLQVSSQAKHIHSVLSALKQEIIQRRQSFLRFALVFRLFREDFHERARYVGQRTQITQVIRAQTSLESLDVLGEHVVNVA